MQVTPDQVKAGQAVYTKQTLAFYDFVVLGLSNRFIWQCPTQKLLNHYNQHVSKNHLDVGVGTGYFLDHCQFPTPSPRIVLMDLNPDTLAYVSQRIKRYSPEIICQNILEPIHSDLHKFDSIGINYLLHCLPGAIATKGILFDHLKSRMNPNAVIFGSTLLQADVQHNWMAQKLMGFYNQKGIFCNQNDSLQGLDAELKRRFKNVTIEIEGCAAIFTGRF